MMKVKITLDKNASSSTKNDALSNVIKEIGAKVTISGDLITVEEGSDERKVLDILNKKRVTYTRST
jgi:hypothetical protein